MWCKHCRQDTPCIAATSRHGMCCGRCGVPLSGDGESKPAGESGRAHPAEIGIDLNQGAPPGIKPGFDDWQLEQNLRRLQARIDPLHRQRPARPKMSTASRRPQWRVDAAHAPVRPPHSPRRRTSVDRPGRSPTFTNSALLLGLVACVGGVGVLGYSVVESRGELWNVGLSAVVAGGVVFLMGLVLQLERIWHNSRVAVQKLRQIDTHLQDLERTTAALGVTHGSASQAFYTHMADSASPHLLLSDLKGQIDLLALSLSRR
jgi:hypothetical protein